ncbi:hypothetical protein, partial [Treponema sp.]|uniref:hypothetical protein n=1 Tax=Treponema sp. TaxID=166 RepID=UPI00257C41A5
VSFNFFTQNSLKHLRIIIYIFACLLSALATLYGEADADQSSRWNWSFKSSKIMSEVLSSKAASFYGIGSPWCIFLRILLFFSIFFNIKQTYLPREWLAAKLSAYLHISPAQFLLD